jgi:hypothetical protein
VFNGSSRCQIDVKLVLKVVLEKVTVSGEQPASILVINPPLTRSGSTVTLSTKESVPHKFVRVKVRGYTWVTESLGKNIDCRFGFVEIVFPYAQEYERGSPTEILFIIKLVPEQIVGVANVKAATGVGNTVMFC